MPIQPDPIAILAYQRGLELREVARLTGIDRGTLRRARRGLFRLSDASAGRLAEVLGVHRSVIDETLAAARAKREGRRDG